jgi:hypothetical protein
MFIPCRNTSSARPHLHQLLCVNFWRGCCAVSRTACHAVGVSHCHVGVNQDAHLLGSHKASHAVHMQLDAFTCSCAAAPGHSPYRATEHATTHAHQRNSHEVSHALRNAVAQQPQATTPVCAYNYRATEHATTHAHLRGSRKHYVSASVCMQLQGKRARNHTHTHNVRWLRQAPP